MVIWPFQIKVCLANNSKKRVEVKKAFNEILKNPNVENVKCEEGVKRRGCCIQAFCQIIADTEEDAEMFNDLLSAQFESDLTKIFGPGLSGLRYGISGFYKP